MEDTEKKPVGRKPARERFVIEAEKQYRVSGQAKLDKLTRKRTLYRRRLTLALAGLEETQAEIEELLLGLGRDRLCEALPEDERLVRFYKKSEGYMEVTDPRIDRGRP